MGRGGVHREWMEGLLAKDEYGVSNKFVEIGTQVLIGRRETSKFNLIYKYKKSSYYDHP